VCAELLNKKRVAFFHVLALFSLHGIVDFDGTSIIMEGGAMLLALDGEEMEEAPGGDNGVVQHEEELVPYTDEWETITEARIAISTVLYRRSLPFYTHQSSRRQERWELRCPRIKQGIPCRFIVSAASHAACSGRIRIVRRCFDYSCGCTMEGGNQMRVKSKWVSSQTAHDVVRDIVGATPADLQRTLHTLHHVEVNYKAAWQARQAVLKLLASRELLSNQLIRPYFSKLKGGSNARDYHSIRT
jgi:hypothetical protein